MGFTLSEVPPTAIDISTDLIGSPLKKSEAETIACNIIVLSRWHGGWFSFSWEEYQQLCKHDVTLSEKTYLDQFISQGMLSFVNGKYTPTDKFIQTLKQFVKKS